MRLILVGGDVVSTSSFWADVARGREKRRRSELADRRVEARVASQLHAEQARSVRAETARRRRSNARPWRLRPGFVALLSPTMSVIYAVC